MKIMQFSLHLDPDPIHIFSFLFHIFLPQFLFLDIQPFFPFFTRKWFTYLSVVPWAKVVFPISLVWGIFADAAILPAQLVLDFEFQFVALPPSSFTRFFLSFASFSFFSRSTLASSAWISARLLTCPEYEGAADQFACFDRLSLSSSSLRRISSRASASAWSLASFSCRS